MDDNGKTKEHLMQELEDLRLRIAELEKSETERKRTEEASKLQSKIISNMAEGVVLIQTDSGKIVYANPKFEKMFGYEADELIGKDISSLNASIHISPKEVARNIVESLLKDSFWQGEVLNIKKDGTQFWCYAIVSTFAHRDYGNVWIAVHNDITERKLLEKKHAELNRVREELIASKALCEKIKIITDNLVQIFEADFVRIWIVNPGDKCSECLHAQIKEGPNVCRHLDKCLHLTASSGRYTHLDGEVHGRVPFGLYMIGSIAAGNIIKFLTNDIIHEPIIENHDWAKELGLVSSAGYRLLSKDGSPVGVLALFSRHVISSNDDALLEGMANSTSQVIQNARMDELLQESEVRYRTAIEQSNDGVVLVKGDRHLFANQRMAEIFGYDRPEEIIGQPVTLVIHPDDQERVMDITLRRQKGGAVPTKYEFIGQRKNGDPIPIEVSATRTTYQGEAVSLAYLRDITDRKQAEEALKTMSLTDEMTGLYNRRGFFTLAEQGLKTAQRMGTEMLLIFGDLDNLKGINDTQGHKEGDQALMDISQIIKETFRESDIIARLGGDEFVILAMNSLETTAEKLIKRFETILKDHPLQRGRPYALSMSLGVACFDPQNPCSIEVMLSQADKLMYENKQKKRRLD